MRDGVDKRAGAQTPNPKIQNPNKLQTTNSKRRTPDDVSLEFEFWNLFGIWILDFAIFSAIVAAWV